MAINTATDPSRLKRDNESPLAARSGIDGLSSTRNGDFARMLQDQAAQRASTAAAAARGREGASARLSRDQGDANPASQAKPQSAAPSATLRVDVEQRNAVARQSQQGLQQASRERADLEARRSEAAKAETKSASPMSAAGRKPAASETSAAPVVTDPAADEQQVAQDAPATMAAWLRNAARANRAGHAPAAGDRATAPASDNVPPRSEDELTVASPSLPGTVAQDTAAALAASGAFALAANLAGQASQTAGNSAGNDGLAGSGRLAAHGGKSTGGLGSDGTDSGSESAASLTGKDRSGAAQPGLDDRLLPAGAEAAKSAGQHGAARLAAGGDGMTLTAGEELAAAPVERQGRPGQEGELGARASDFAQVSGAATWDTRLALDGVKSSDALAAAVPISTPVQDEGFGEHVSLTVGNLARQGIESATLQLNPAEMGPVAVSIALAGDQARVNFTADRDDTRKALEASLNQLDAAFRADGMVLVEAQVAPPAPASDARGTDTGTASGQGYPQGGAGDGGRNGADQGSGEPRNRWAAAGKGPAARHWDLRVDAADGSLLSSSPRTGGTNQLDLYA